MRLKSLGSLGHQGCPVQAAALWLRQGARPPRGVGAGSLGRTGNQSGPNIGTLDELSITALNDA